MRKSIWTYDKCKEEAAKYQSRYEFQKHSQSAYNSSLKNKWLNDVCSHMKLLMRCYYWTFERCKEEALKYNTKKDFVRNSGTAYNVARQNKWLDEICYHMISLGNPYKRCIYTFEFSDNCVYVGLTGNINNRKSQHFNDKDSTVYKYIQKTGLQPELKQLTNYIDKDLAAIKEGEFVDEYNKNGWNILNKAKTGGLGCLFGVSIWNFEKCQIEALKYRTRNEFQKNSPTSYKISCDKKWLNDICLHMEQIIKPHNYWTKEKCQEESLKYELKSKFQKSSSSAYSSAKKNGWLNDICSHMINTKKIIGYWTYEKCKEEALKYNSKTEFQKKCSSAYTITHRNKWLNIICNHMIEKQKPKGYWTKEKCQTESLNYQSKKEFRKNSGGAYDFSYRMGWLNEICSHMLKNKVKK